MGAYAGILRTAGFGRKKVTLYVCIESKKTWKIENGGFDLLPRESLCKPCLKESLVPIYRKRQLKEGTLDCFGRPIDHCDKLRCKYRELSFIPGPLSE